MSRTFTSVLRKSIYSSKGKEIRLILYNQCMGACSDKMEDPFKEEVTVHPRCDDPTGLWKALSVSKKHKGKYKTLDPLSFDTPKPANHARFVCISDTHNRTDQMELPDGDVLLHAGDFSNTGMPGEVEHFNSLLGRVKSQFKHVIVIAGNHDLTFDDDGYDSCGLREYFHRGKNFVVKEVKAKLTNCTYLMDEEVNVMGFRIYGSPWQPEFGGWAFNLPRGQSCLDKWNKIPEAVDILMTHGPPLGQGDLCRSGLRAGCSELLTTIQNRVKPKVHIFGHIHEGYGITTDGTTMFINASSVNVRYEQKYPPIIFDLPIPEAH